MQRNAHSVTRMRFSHYHLSFLLAIPVGLVFGFVGGAVFAAISDTVNGYLNPVTLVISIICGGISGVAHSMAGLGGGLLGAGVANTCQAPMHSRVTPAFVGSAVANTIGWAVFFLVLTQTMWAGLPTLPDPVPFLLLAAPCVLVSSAVAAALVALDERFPEALAGIAHA